MMCRRGTYVKIKVEGQDGQQNWGVRGRDFARFRQSDFAGDNPETPVTKIGQRPAEELWLDSRYTIPA